MSLDDEERQRLRQRFVEYSETRDRAIRDELIEAHLRLAEHLARRFANRGVALDDLVQVASLGLVKAVSAFYFGGRKLSIAEVREAGARFEPFQNLTAHYLLIGYRMFPPA